MSEYKYQSPIELIQSEMKMRVDDGIVKAVQDVGVNVDKDELLKALAYDRDQYNKGYNDGKPKEGGWMRNLEDLESGFIRCVSCGTQFDYYLINQLAMESCDADFPNFCPNCGARMKGE